MNYKYVFLTAIRGITSQLTRSALTILGIVIGVAAIIIIMSLGEGAQKLILDEVSGLGAETLILRPGEDKTDITAVLFTRSITKRDVDLLKRKENVPNLISVAPTVMVSDPVEYKGEKFKAMVFGGVAEFMVDMIDLKLADGELSTQKDIDQHARVAIIGYDLKQDMFGNESAVGKKIRIKKRSFEIVGVFEDTSNVGPLTVNEMVMIPYTTAQTYLTGNDYYNEVMLRADATENVQKMSYDIELTMRDAHDIDFGDDDDFNVQTQDDIIGQIKTIVNIFTAFLASVVAISLVVGGIGIMNIMLVSVSERTKEIGLRKALGARSKDILRQFLTEATILTGAGGVIGVAVGTFISVSISVVLARTIAENWTFTFPVFGAFLGVGVSVIVGIIFGIYPAYQASKKSPIEALRYE